MKKSQEMSLNIIIVAVIALIVLVVLVMIFTGRFTFKLPEPERTKYDEVIYDCGERLVIGTEVPNSEWDLENGVEVYYLYATNYSVTYHYPIREWKEDFNAVGLQKGGGGCKEILRFYNYTIYNPKSN